MIKKIASHSPISVCFCIDENYVRHLGVVLGSLVESNSHNNVDVYVITQQIAESSKDRLATVIEGVGKFTITFIGSQDKKVQKLEADGHISAATYIRFELPSLLNKLDKVLYLDADLVITDDLSDFWNVNVTDHYVAAVENPFFDRYESLGMEPKQGYFNAGVLLLNLSRWRIGEVESKALEYLSNHQSECLMFDQDALNAVFQGNWKRVDLRWNLQTSFLRRRKELPLLAKEIKVAYGAPGIVHYSSSSKPWDTLAPHPLTYLYRRHEQKFGKYRKKMTFLTLIRSPVKWVFLKVVYFFQIQ
ncbi:MAG: glycosyltransferase family 8 protein [Methylococcales symbiont of Hymedesmia sp. n. MRB-2018]|nr:MAG: glycosyltransferase family 8 protein [Methylococcales symbiont of Hymedesmia sp. n. MRB-2018]